MHHEANLCIDADLPFKELTEVSTEYTPVSCLAMRHSLTSKAISPTLITQGTYSYSWINTQNW